MHWPTSETKEVGLAYLRLLQLQLVLEQRLPVLR